MGSGYLNVCRKCGTNCFLSLGIGMRFPKVYVELIEESKKGTYGAEQKKITTEEPQIAINGSNDVYLCRECEYQNLEPNLSLYRLNHYASPDDELVPYYMGSLTYDLAKRYVHKCSKCGKRMRAIEDREYRSLPCKVCGGHLEKV